jgi:hypothetical protein
MALDAGDDGVVAVRSFYRRAEEEAERSMLLHARI